MLFLSEAGRVDWRINFSLPSHRHPHGHWLCCNDGTSNNKWYQKKNGVLVDYKLSLSCQEEGQLPPGSVSFSATSMLTIIFCNNPERRSSQTLHCTFIKKLLWSLSHTAILLRWITHLNVSCMAAHHTCIHMLKAQAGERGFSIWWLMQLGKSLFGYSHIVV